MFCDVIIDLIMALVKVEEMGGDPAILGRRTSVDNRAADIFNMLDVDNDGELTMEEFVDGYLRYCIWRRWNSQLFVGVNLVPVAGGVQKRESRNLLEMFILE